MNSEVIKYTRNKALLKCDTKGVIISSSAGCLNILGIVPERGVNLTSLIPGAIEKIMTRLAYLQTQDCFVEIDEFNIWATKLGSNELLLDIIDASILKQLESSNLELHKNVFNLREKASLGTMVAQLCHEMNTPLGVSTTGITFLQDRCDQLNLSFQNNTLKKSELDNFLNQLKKTLNLSSSNLARATKILKDMRNIYENVTALDKSWNTFKALETTISQDLGTLLKKQNVALEISEIKNERLYMDWSALYQIFMNLVTNSLKHGFKYSTPKVQKSIKIEVTKENDTHLKILYFDNGIGIQNLNYDKVFEPFFTTGDSTDSSGLGLSIIVDILAERLQGKIKLKEREIGVLFEMTIKDVKWQQTR